ncbi:acyl-CoA dehydrogenase C-terminal domain-containing protein [Variovorax rhizosphaerae]|uniref:Acyl-CoA dehydrogenase C-terminal domain-containing protein n=1 Tax=Variovorax rhizosphaerae TaxID=1836200 RepID=A0ABU8WVB9_9BURK
MPHPQTYVAPTRELQFILHEWLDAATQLQAHSSHTGIQRTDIDTLIAELGRFAENEVGPLNAIGDSDGCSFHDGKVTTPAGFREAYASWCTQGFPGLTAAKEDGGRALPNVMTNLVIELVGSANHSWLMYASISRGAYECIRANGSPQQRALYLPKLASGEWTGSMCMSETQAGTDVGLLQTSASPQADGSYRLTGLKRMATVSEHDFGENIVHLVLARIEGAPPGSRGISLFIVPKFLPDAEHRPGARNAAWCEGLEDKMGIRGTPTCWLRFDGATGFLLGEANKGLQAMFVMMNIARLATGMQGVNQSERGYQVAVDHARHRLQGRSASGNTVPGREADPLIAHADVRRMLFTQKAWLEAGRAFGYWLALQVDRAQAHPDAAARHDADELVALLTPVFKAFSSDNGYACTTLAQQIMGGAGYLGERGVDQFIRDARVAQIYEGANGIQGQDLLGRKVLADGGNRLARFQQRVAASLARIEPGSSLRPFADSVLELGERIGALVPRIARRAAANPDQIGASGQSFLRVLGLQVYGWLWTEMALVALPHAADSPFHAAKLATARFYFAYLFPEAEHHLRVADIEADVVMTADESLF